MQNNKLKIWNSDDNYALELSKLISNPVFQFAVEIIKEGGMVKNLALQYNPKIVEQSQYILGLDVGVQTVFNDLERLATPTPQPNNETIEPSYRDE